jgi:hypothetical protein
VTRFVEDTDGQIASKAPNDPPAGTAALTRQPLAEADFQRYFQVSPPVVQATVKTLEQWRCISSAPGRALSISPPSNVNNPRGLGVARQPLSPTHLSLAQDCPV